MTEPNDQKLHAIELHSEQAEAFDARYEALTKDPYSSVFAYGRHKIELFLERLVSKLNTDTRALDVGCGTGFNLARLRARGFDVVGVEPAEGMRAIAQKRNPGVEIVGGDIESLPFPDESFDLVIAIEVIRYVPNPIKALAEVARVLRPGGLAVVTAAPRWSLNGYALVNKLTSRVQVPGFAKVRQGFMSVKSARHALSSAGFSLGAIHGAFLGPWILLERISKRAIRGVLRRFEPIDDYLSDRWPFRDMANHLILVGRR